MNIPTTTKNNPPTIPLGYIGKLWDKIMCISAIKNIEPPIMINTTPSNFVRFTIIRSFLRHLLNEPKFYYNGSDL